VFNTKIITIVLDIGILKLGTIVTSNFHKSAIKFILGPFCKLFEKLGNNRLIMQKEHPSIARIIINNHKTMTITTNYGTNGRDRIDPPRVYGNGDDDVSGDVTTGDGSGSRARRRTTARWRKRTAPTGSGRRGEPYRGTNGDGRQPDDDGDEDEAAAAIGSTTTALR